jgi:hypothetical protein
MRGAEGDRTPARARQEADPGQALQCRSRPARSLPASGPRDLTEPEGRRRQATGLPRPPGRGTRITTPTENRNTGRRREPASRLFGGREAFSFLGKAGRNRKTVRGLDGGER